MFVKLRIRGNSIRIRVSQPELQAFVEQGSVRDRIQFDAANGLTYGIETSAEIDTPRAVFDGASVTVLLPTAQVEAWADPEAVSLQGSQPIGDGEDLTILVEKDFACLVPREGEEQESLFPNPRADAC